MEVLLAIAFIWGAWYFISNNIKQTKESTEIKETEVIKTKNGEKVITRVTVTDKKSARINNDPTFITDVDLETKSNMANSYLPHTHKSRDQVVTYKDYKQEQLPFDQPQSTINLPSKSVDFKLCTGCNRTQPTTEFRFNPKREDKLTKWCKHCLDNGVPAPANMSGKKICARCGKTRLKTSFYPTTKYNDGLSSVCRFCMPQRKSKRRIKK